jgi:hypothetical protein
LHNALPIDPVTLAVDTQHGVILRPKHLQQAMRNLAGIDQGSVAQLFPLAAEDVDFFNPALRTW